MLKKIFIIFITGILVLGINGLSFAMMCAGNTAHGKHTQIAQAESSEHEHGAMADTQVPSEETVNVGNKICSVSGDKIEEETKATYEYEGKIYNFCCPMCIEEFKKDPEKYIKKVDEELKAQEQEEIVTESEEREHMHEGHQH